jgi:hypothetical protein
MQMKRELKMRKRGEKMKRKVILGIILTVPLLFLTIVTADTSIFVPSPNNNISGSNNVTLTGAAGYLKKFKPVSSFA